MRGILSLLCVALFVHTGFSQTNSFPLYSSGTYSGGSSSDLTDVTNAQLKLNATSGYIRVPHLSASSTVSTVYNYQTGKHVYWGEPGDVGQYIFRGRNVILETSSFGLGASAPSAWFGGWNKMIEVADPRPVLKLTSSGALGTLMFTNSAVNGSSHTGEFHINHEFNSGDPNLSKLRFYGYPAGELLTLLANGNIGIGNANPAASLDIKLTSASAAINILGTGTSPNQIFLQGYDWGGRVFSFSDGNSGNTLGGFAIDGYRRNVSPGIYLRGSHVVANGAGASGTEGTIDFNALTYADQDFTIQSVPHGLHPAYKFRFNNASLMTVTSGGDVGIGTNSPDAKLSVKGQVHAQEVKVDLNGAVAPDYVFNKDYKLPSLEEVKAYIEKNNHLPDVQSAKDLEANGINVGEMNLVLLKKVEELTLYSIQQEETTKELRALLTAVQERLQKLERIK